MDKRLVEYIKKRLKDGEDPFFIKEQLIAIGWPEEIVDSAFESCYKKKIKISTVISISFPIIVGLIIFFMFINYKVGEIRIEEGKIEFGSSEIEIINISCMPGNNGYVNLTVKNKGSRPIPAGEIIVNITYEGFLKESISQKIEEIMPNEERNIKIPSSTMLYSFGYDFVISFPGGLTQFCSCLAMPKIGVL